MLSPKRVKWRKSQKGKMRGRALRGGTVHFGEFGLVATECGRITSKQLESARVAMTRYVKRGGQIWVRVFPDKSLTKKPAETRMGSGKGGVEAWAAVIKPGRVIFEMAGVPQVEAYEALRLAKHKLAVSCKPMTKAQVALTLAPKAKAVENASSAKTGAKV